MKRPSGTETARRDARGRVEARARLFEIPFSTAPAEAVLAEAQAGPGSGPRLIVTANIDHVIVLSENAAFRRAYANATVRTLDGMPLVWIARALGHRAVHRVTGHDLLALTLTGPAPAGRRVFVVCSTQAVAARMAQRFAATGLAADAVRTVIPPFGFEGQALYSARLARDVRSHGTTLLVLGVGAPKSEIWVDRHAAGLGAPVCLAVGEAVTVAAGMVPRAPILLQRVGLEWLFRFAHAPQRLFGRYFVRSWRFLAILLAGGRSLRMPEIPAPKRVPTDRLPPRSGAGSEVDHGPARPAKPRPVATPQLGGPKPQFLKAARQARALSGEVVAGSAKRKRSSSKG